MQRGHFSWIRKPSTRIHQLIVKPSWRLLTNLEQSLTFQNNASEAVTQASTQAPHKLPHNLPDSMTQWHNTQLSDWLNIKGWCISTLHPVFNYDMNCKTIVTPCIPDDLLLLLILAPTPTSSSLPSNQAPGLFGLTFHSDHFWPPTTQLNREMKGNKLWYQAYDQNVLFIPKKRITYNTFKIVGGNCNDEQFEIIFMVT